ncbi:hypothetical protein SAMN06272771_6560 [Streptomyces sp. Ag82_O1-12]|uniref:hypothetical protein n=1 Tax=unclassified Streptomyces TaxID=2593676 RepID=UPI000BCF713A|nr:MULTISPECIES: hypothetical protein [unclassified Streptomyces]SMQ20138.1 hypothetical protein SAMN06272771_6560 [Streptomyces sp. Ag82_O1-12]SOD49098.1 hypothetical protein SAMN06272727_6565 [Streptomyces sp. Ag82_G6-1]
MRRSLHALSVAVLAGSALVGFAPVVSAEPAAEVGPATVQPGGTLTVSVSCDPTGGPPPDSIDATSEAFDEGTVALQRVTGNDDEVSGPAYRGTAGIASAENFEGDPDAPGEDSAWSVEGDPDAPGEDSAWSVEGDADAPGEDSAWSVEGTCPAAPGGEGATWSATFTVAHGSGSHKPSHQPTHEPPYDPTHPPTHKPCPEPSLHPEPHHTECGGPPVERGVRAGDGGAFTDSVPALVAGGVLIAGAFGAAAHRLRHRESDPHR